MLFRSRLADTRGEELQAADIWTLFKQSYLEANTPLRLENARVLSSDEGATVELTVSDDKGSHSLKGSGNGPIDACKKALVDLIPSSAVTAYYQHALDQKGAESTAIAYIQIEQNGRSTFGVGIDANIAVASIRAVFSALNRLA